MPFPSRSVVFAAVALALGLVAAAPAHALFGGALPLNKCVNGKVNCVSKAKACLLKCHVKALGTGTAVDPICLAKCRDRFEGDHAVTDRGCFAKQEERGGCGVAVGDAGTFAARIDAHVQELVREINPTGGTPDNNCAAKKLGCVRKYNRCVLDLVRKATKSGASIGDPSKCTRILDGTDTSCIGKLERQYADLPCLTQDDQGRLRNQDDAFVDDVIEALVSGAHDVDTQRCSGDTSVSCTSAPGGVAGCGGPLGTCEFFAGPPQAGPPIIFGGGSCLINQWQGPITGTFDQGTGASAGTGAVVSRIYSSPSAYDGGCPRCQDDPFVNDGAADGTCVGGSRNGLTCDGNGRSPEPAFGTTSLDCPPTPATIIGTSLLNLTSGNTGLAKTVTVASPNCNGAPGKKCLCGSCSGNSDIACESDADCVLASAGTCTNAAGAAREPNGCSDDTAVPGDGSVCLALGAGEGVCPEGPVDTVCAIETFRGCSVNSDCPATNDRCTTRVRECFAGYNGNVGDSVSAIGAAAPARNGAAAVTVGTLACQAPIVLLYSAALGLPGPLRWELDGVSENDGGPSCPTRLSFLPTSKGPAADLGWTGFIHDQRQIGQAKVTVATTCTGTHPNCSCTYTGPIANPNAP